MLSRRLSLVHDNASHTAKAQTLHFIYLIILGIDPYNQSADTNQPIPKQELFDISSFDGVLLNSDNSSQYGISLGKFISSLRTSPHSPFIHEFFLRCGLTIDVDADPKFSKKWTPTLFTLFFGPKYICSHELIPILPRFLTIIDDVIAGCGIPLSSHPKHVSSRISNSSPLNITFPGDPDFQSGLNTPGGPYQLTRSQSHISAEVQNAIRSSHIGASTPTYDRHHHHHTPTLSSLKFDDHHNVSSHLQDDDEVFSRPVRSSTVYSTPQGLSTGEKPAPLGRHLSIDDIDTELSAEYLPPMDRSQSQTRHSTPGDERMLGGDTIEHISYHHHDNENHNPCHHGESQPEATTSQSTHDTIMRLSEYIQSIFSQSYGDTFRYDDVLIDESGAHEVVPKMSGVSHNPSSIVSHSDDHHHLAHHLHGRTSFTLTTPYGRAKSHSASTGHADSKKQTHRSTSSTALNQAPGAVQTGRKRSYHDSDLHHHDHPENPLNTLQLMTSFSSHRPARGRTPSSRRPSSPSHHQTQTTSFDHQYQHHPHHRRHQPYHSLNNYVEVDVHEEFNEKSLISPVPGRNGHTQPQWEQFDPERVLTARDHRQVAAPSHHLDGSGTNTLPTPHTTGNTLSPPHTDRDEPSASHSNHAAIPPLLATQPPPPPTFPQLPSTFTITEGNDTVTFEIITTPCPIASLIHDSNGMTQGEQSMAINSSAAIIPHYCRCLQTHLSALDDGQHHSTTKSHEPTPSHSHGLSNGSCIRFQILHYPQVNLVAPMATMDKCPSSTPFTRWQQRLQRPVQLVSSCVIHGAGATIYCPDCSPHISTLSKKPNPTTSSGSTFLEVPPNDSSHKKSHRTSSHVVHPSHAASTSPVHVHEENPSQHEPKETTSIHSLYENEKEIDEYEQMPSLAASYGKGAQSQNYHGFQQHHDEYLAAYSSESPLIGTTDLDLYGGGGGVGATGSMQFNNTMVDNLSHKSIQSYDIGSDQFSVTNIDHLRRNTDLNNNELQPYRGMEGNTSLLSPTQTGLQRDEESECDFTTPTADDVLHRESDNEVEQALRDTHQHHGGLGKNKKSRQVKRPRLGVLTRMRLYQWSFCIKSLSFLLPSHSTLKPIQDIATQSSNGVSYSDSKHHLTNPPISDNTGCRNDGTTHASTQPSSHVADLPQHQPILSLNVPSVLHCTDSHGNVSLPAVGSPQHSLSTYQEQLGPQILLSHHEGEPTSLSKQLSPTISTSTLHADNTHTTSNDIQLDQNISTNDSLSHHYSGGLSKPSTTLQSATFLPLPRTIVNLTTYHSTYDMIEVAVHSLLRIKQGYDNFLQHFLPHLISTYNQLDNTHSGGCHNEIDRNTITMTDIYDGSHKQHQAQQQDSITDFVTFHSLTPQYLWTPIRDYQPPTLSNLIMLCLSLDTYSCRQMQYVDWLRLASRQLSFEMTSSMIPRHYLFAESTSKLPFSRDMLPALSMVHCVGGKGRTGCVISAYWIYQCWKLSLLVGFNHFLFAFRPPSSSLSSIKSGDQHRQVFSALPCTSSLFSPGELVGVLFTVLMSIYDYGCCLCNGQLHGFIPHSCYKDITSSLASPHTSTVFHANEVNGGDHYTHGLGSRSYHAMIMHYLYQQFSRVVAHFNLGDESQRVQALVPSRNPAACLSQANDTGLSRVGTTISTHQDHSMIEGRTSSLSSSSSSPYCYKLCCHTTSNHLQPSNPDTQNGRIFMSLMAHVHPIQPSLLYYFHHSNTSSNSMDIGKTDDGVTSDILPISTQTVSGSSLTLASASMNPLSAPTFETTYDSARDVTTGQPGDTHQGVVSGPTRESGITSTSQLGPSPPPFRPSEAINFIRSLRQGSIETPGQENILFTFYDYLRTFACPS